MILYTVLPPTAIKDPSGDGESAFNGPPICMTCFVGDKLEFICVVVVVVDD